MAKISRRSVFGASIFSIFQTAPAAAQTTYAPLASSAKSLSVLEGARGARIMVFGYNVLGDCEPALFVGLGDEPRTPWAIPGANGSAWEISTDKPDPRMFGAVGDGETDDTDALQNTIDYLSSRQEAGAMHLPSLAFACRRLRLRKGVGIKGDGGLTRPHYPSAINSTRPALILDPRFSIEMEEGASIRGVNIRPTGMTLPQNEQQVQAWQGTAIVVTDEAHGVYIGDASIIGFNTAIASPGKSPTTRAKMENLAIDCQNGIHISNSPDISSISEVHCWPFASTGRGSENYTYRAGTAFKLADRVDWGKLTNCFCFGYEIGFELLNVSDCTLSGCGADHDAKRAHRTSTGFKLHGTSDRNQLNSCQAAAQAIGIHVALGASKGAAINGASLWDNTIAIHLSSGALTVTATQSKFRGAIKVDGNATAITLSGVASSKNIRPAIIVASGKDSIVHGIVESIL